ncbi:MAG: tyrosine-type recombinase/integrase [Cytophagales bacterium]|nr:tyrosine-type recombinase/integrase [Cytophagales bacterium]
MARKGKFLCQVRWTSNDSDKRRSKNKTFKNKSAAKAWGKLKVKELEVKISKGEETLSLDNSIKTLGDLIEAYLDDSYVQAGRSKRMSLKAVTKCDIANKDVQKLHPKHFVDYAKERKAAGASPATVAADISHIRAVLKTARALFDVNANENPIVQALPTLHTLKLIGKSNIRTRRPTEEEVDKLLIALKEKEKNRSTVIPYSDLFEFSILSCMRVGEICEILWEDLNEDEEWVWVRDRKDPRKKDGNHMKVPLLGGAFEIVMSQPRDKPRIFPFNSRSVTTGYRNTRNKLRIEDLRYHDLRREGASRLFEQGYPIEKVAQVTGHKDLNTLWQIYTNLYPDKKRF